MKQPALLVALCASPRSATMPDPTGAARQQRWRDRQRTGQAATVCQCGRKAYGEHAPLCRKCWLVTNAGREWNRLRIARLRAAKRNG
jgi:hypothetical protein